MVSISRASSRASLAACAAVRVSPFASDQAMISRASASCRPMSLIAGRSSPAASVARSSALASAPRSSSAPPMMGLILGSSSAVPPAAFRNASCRARVARRVGSSKVVSASCSGSGRAPPGTGSVARQQRVGERCQERPARRDRVDAAQLWQGPGPSCVQTG